jgi:hypothetical protein
MGRVSVAATGLVAAALFGAVPAGASVPTSLRVTAAGMPAGAARAVSSCKRLLGKDIAPAPRVKLVRRRNEDNGTDLLGCVLPRGHVRTLAQSADLTTTTKSYTIAQVSGAVVLLTSSSTSQYGSDQRVDAVDIRTGRGYLIAGSCYQLGGGLCGDAQNVTAAAAFVNSRGQAVAALIPEGTQITVVTAFSSDGDRDYFDFGPSADLPASSLTLVGSVARWTHSGEPRSATISG